MNNRFLICLRQPGQCAYSTLREDHVTMALGVADAAFVAERRIKPPRQTESVGSFLRKPPRILASSSVVVIRATEPIHRSHINRVAPHVFERPIVAAVAADFGVPMKFTARQVECLALVLNLPVAAALDFGPLLLGGCRRLGVRGRSFFCGYERKRQRLSRNFEAANENVVVERVAYSGQRIIAAALAHNLPVLPMVGRVG